MAKKWTKEELELLKRYYETSTKKKLLEIFPDRTYYSIEVKAGRIGLTKTVNTNENAWTEEELELLRDNFYSKSSDKLSELLPLRNKKSIQTKAERIGLRKKKNKKIWSKEENNLFKTSISSLYN